MGNKISTTKIMLFHPSPPTLKKWLKREKRRVGRKTQNNTEKVVIGGSINCIHSDQRIDNNENIVLITEENIEEKIIEDVCSRGHFCPPHCEKKDIDKSRARNSTSSFTANNVASLRESFEILQVNSGSVQSKFQDNAEDYGNTNFVQDPTTNINLQAFSINSLKLPLQFRDSPYSDPDVLAYFAELIYLYKSAMTSDDYFTSGKGGTRRIEIDQIEQLTLNVINEIPQLKEVYKELDWKPYQNYGITIQQAIQQEIINSIPIEKLPALKDGRTGVAEIRATVQTYKLLQQLSTVLEKLTVAARTLKPQGGVYQ